MQALAVVHKVPSTDIPTAALVAGVAVLVKATDIVPASPLIKNSLLALALGNLAISLFKKYG